MIDSFSGRHPYLTEAERKMESHLTALVMAVGPCREAELAYELFQQAAGVRDYHHARQIVYALVRSNTDWKCDEDGYWTWRNYN